MTSTKFCHVWYKNYYDGGKQQRLSDTKQSMSPPKVTVVDCKHRAVCVTYAGFYAEPSIKRGLRVKQLAEITNGSMRQRRRQGEMYCKRAYRVAEEMRTMI